MDKPDKIILDRAPMAVLSATAITPEARALASRVVDLITLQEQRKRARTAAAVRSLSRAVEAFLGDLMAYAPQDGHGAFVFHTLDANSFSGTTVAYRQFVATVKALKANGLIHTVPGYRAETPIDWGGGVISRVNRGRVSRFRATPELLAIASEFGIVPGDCRDHFHQPRPEQPIVLKAKSQRLRSQKVKGGTLEVPDTPEVRRLADQVRTINDFMDTISITGGVHRGFSRHFEHGDQPDFRWNKGGRLYSIGTGNYQTLKEAARLEMTFNGEVVVEIDIKSSYLTILHGIAGIPIDLTTDPYELPGVPREVVKGWLVATLGAEKHLRRWPPAQTAGYREMTTRDLGGDHPIKLVQEKMTERYPVLQRVGQPGHGWADLMFLESEAIIKTMLNLISAGVPSLPVHDSLIVPASTRDFAVATLTSSYKAIAGVEPGIEVCGRRTDKEASTLVNT